MYGSHLGETSLGSCFVGNHYDFLWEILIIDSESELELVITTHPLDALDVSSGAAVGNAKDIVGNGKEHLADKSSRGFCSSYHIVTNAKQ